MDVVWHAGELAFEWDEDKAQANLERHGVSFPEASEVFFDPLARLLSAESVDVEERETTIGERLSLRLVLVVHTERWAYPDHLGPRGQRSRTSMV